MGKPLPLIFWADKGFPFFVGEGFTYVWVNIIYAHDFGLTFTVLDR